MKKNIIGLMSGTSCDGLDLVYCQFQSTDTGYTYKMLVNEFVPYEQQLANKLKAAIGMTSAELIAFHHTFGDFLGEQVRLFITKFQLDSIDWVASHGHTVLHRPDEGYTFQIGRGENIVKACGLPVICDFRVQDVVLGGQGAPLVPVGDHFLFSEYDACVNLGGFANISLMKEGKRIAFDISPFNILLNPLAEQLGFPFDAGGDIARKGELNDQLLDKLNDFNYYERGAPKSLAFEDVQTFFNPILTEFDIPIQDSLKTLLIHYVKQLICALPPQGKVLLTGGGAKNNYFVKLLKEAYKGEIILPSTEIIDFKESIVFAFLGYLRSENEVNVFSSVTGASKDHSAGCIFN